MPAEEFLWCKLYVLQRDRCDWPDLINLLNACGPALDWPRLFWRVDADAPLLSALLSIFNWVNPQRAGALPQHENEALTAAAEEPFAPQTRAALLDSRPWFAPPAPEDKQS